MSSKFTLTKDELLSSLGNPAFRIPNLAHFEQFEGDKDVALATVSRTGDLLHLFSNELRDDKDVVMAAVIQNPRSIRLAGVECCADKDIARHVLYNEKRANVLTNFSDEIRNDHDLIASALPNIMSAGLSIKSDKAVMTEIVKARPDQFAWSSSSLFQDHDYCKMAINIDPSNVANLPENHALLRDKPLALETLKLDHENLRYFKALQDDAQVVHVALKSEEWAYSSSNPKQVINTNEESILQYASERIQKACENSDPHKVLGAMALSDKLQTKLAPKQEPRRPSIKI